MAVERVDYSSDEEYHHALIQEQEEYQNQEPNVVPCYLCGNAMYENDDDPKYNICSNCMNRLNGQNSFPDNNISKEDADILPF